MRTVDHGMSAMIMAPRGESGSQQKLMVRPLNIFSANIILDSMDLGSHQLHVAVSSRPYDTGQDSVIEIAAIATRCFVSVPMIVSC